MTQLTTMAQLTTERGPTLACERARQRSRIVVHRGGRAIAARDSRFGRGQSDAAAHLAHRQATRTMAKVPKLSEARLDRPGLLSMSLRTMTLHVTVTVTDAS